VGPQLGKIGTNGRKDLQKKREKGIGVTIFFFFWKEGNTLQGGAIRRGGAKQNRPKRM